VSTRSYSSRWLPVNQSCVIFTGLACHVLTGEVLAKPLTCTNAQGRNTVSRGSCRESRPLRSQGCQRAHAAVTTTRQMSAPVMSNVLARDPCAPVVRPSGYASDGMRSARSAWTR
jgi:hypothetical protein